MQPKRVVRHIGKKKQTFEKIHKRIASIFAKCYCLLKVAGKHFALFYRIANIIKIETPVNAVYLIILNLLLMFF